MKQKCLGDIDFTVKHGVLNCWSWRLTSLKGCPEGVTKLNCGSNYLTSLEGCPESVTELICSYNNLTSLEGLPGGMTELDCYSNKLTSLEECSTFKSLTTLNCSYNNLTSLKGCSALKSLTTLYCWHNNLTSLEGCQTLKSLTTLNCGSNKLTSLKGCPEGVTELVCYNNPLNKEYKDKTIEQIHQINYIKRLKKGINIVNNIIREKSALNIQRAWDNYWYKPNKDGESRAAKWGYMEFNNFLLQAV